MTRCPRWIDAPNLAELPKLDALEACDAMQFFLDAYWERGLGASDDLAILLSSIERDDKIRPDGGTLDPASWDDWVKAIQAMKLSKPSAS